MKFPLFKIAFLSAFLLTFVFSNIKAEEINPKVARQIQALIKEKESRTPAEKKIETLSHGFH